MLAGLGFFAAASLPALAVEEVGLYFGVGNFHHLQHEFVIKEALLLGRRGPDITANAGFAGGTEVGAYDRVCYKRFASRPNYADLGHTEVVSVFLPLTSVGEFTKFYFDEVEKRFPKEDGSQYRPVIGVREGLKSEAYKLISEATPPRFKLVKGEGDEKGSFKQDVVYVYDTRLFPFRPAELNNQFSDTITQSATEEYEIDYKELRNVMVKIGTATTGCA